jgi:hypothetical protein
MFIFGLTQVEKHWVNNITQSFVSVSFRVVIRGPNLLAMSTFIPTEESINQVALKFACLRAAVNSNF